MPIENERKYVLNLQTSENDVKIVSDCIEHIEQSYLVSGKKQSLRIRKSIVGKNIIYKMTFKQTVAKKTVEVETLISQKDYDMLYETSTSRLKKTRYRVGEWEIDFFKFKGEVYFVQAEIEMPEDKKKPDKIIEIVSKNLLYAVKRSDCRFSSRKLSDPKYSKKLLETINLERQLAW